jgi:renalase
MDADVIVVGAGVSGLACARGLADSGISVLVVERAGQVGGRCATRRVDGQPVDLGPLFLHGHQPEFLAALAVVDGVTRLDGWPARVRGRGIPCQPQALDPQERRVAFAEGVDAFPRQLAAGLDVRLGATVERLEPTAAGWRVHVAGGPPLTGRDVVLALAGEQTRRLLADLPANPRVASIRAVLGMFASLPTLTLAAGYGRDVADPDWDIVLPDEPGALLLAALESSKRPGPRGPTLVLQASPRWSQQRFEAPADGWGAELLTAAADLIGDWVREPLWTRPHRWRYGRLDRGTELASPVLIPFDGGRLGLCGDLFAPGGGLQAAYLSGRRLAQRLTSEVER